MGANSERTGAEQLRVRLGAQTHNAKMYGRGLAVIFTLEILVRGCVRARRAVCAVVAALGAFQLRERHRALVQIGVLN